VQDRAGKSEYEELMIEAASQEEKLAWIAALNAHTNYVEASLKVALQVEAEVVKKETGAATAAAAVPGKCVCKPVTLKGDSQF
jgi:hypothetical protein